MDGLGGGTGGVGGVLRSIRVTVNGASSPSSFEVDFLLGGRGGGGSSGGSPIDSFIEVDRFMPLLRGGRGGIGGGSGSEGCDGVQPTKLNKYNMIYPDTIEILPSILEESSGGPLDSQIHITK